MKKLKEKLRAIIPQKLVDFASYKPQTPYETVCYGQYAEDLILSKIFAGKEKGFYVDVGAHHPFRFSNTFLFYKLGWRGVNIDPLPGVKQLFDKYRPGDLNIEIGVDINANKVSYYMFNHPAYNTFSKEIADLRVKNNLEIQDIKQLNVKPLSEILEECLNPSQEIDFMNIDVEGFDLKVLKSNDWEKFKPKVLVYEELSTYEYEKLLESPIYIFLIELGYSFYTRVYNSIFFKLQDFNN